MLRQNFTKTITSPHIYTKILHLSCIVAFVSWLAFPLFPLLSEPGFTSENAVNGIYGISHYDGNRTLRVYNSIKNLPASDSNATLSYIENFFLRNNVQPKRMDFTASSYSLHKKSTLKGTNLYGIYQTKRGDPSECNLITFNHDLSTKNGNGRFEIALALSLLESFVETQKINYNSRDIIFLAYDGRFKTYGKAIQEFLKDYYSDENTDVDRCGIIRQAINIEIDQDNFNRVALLHQGINARVPDLDFYMLFTQVLDSIMSAVWEPYVNSGYEKKLGTLLQREYYKPLMPFIKNFKPSLPFNSTITLNSLKGLLVGWPHDVHTYLLERGILAVTLKGYHCDTCIQVRQEDIVLAFGVVMEKTNRGLMSLQEQLHAASTAWIATSNRHIYFVLGGLFIVLPLIIAYAVRTLINFYEQGKDRNMLRAALDNAALLPTLWIIYELPRIFEFGLSLVEGSEVSLCSPISHQGIAYNQSFLLLFIFSAMAILVLGTLGFPILLRRIFSQISIQEYSASQWKTRYALLGPYFVGSLIGWSLANNVFGLIGTFIILPIVFLVSPFSKASPKALVGNVLALLWSGILFIAISTMLRETKSSWLDAAREILMGQACYGSDLYRFIVFFIVPSLVCAWQTLTFRVK